MALETNRLPCISCKKERSEVEKSVEGKATLKGNTTRKSSAKEEKIKNKKREIEKDDDEQLQKTTIRAHYVSPSKIELENMGKILTTSKTSNPKDSKLKLKNAKETKKSSQ